MRRRSLLLGLVVASGLLAMPAAAKDDVRAELLSPVRLDTAYGQRMRIDWRLVEDDGRPFGASGIYLQVSRCGQRPLRVMASPRGSGRYFARLTVPNGRIRELLVGLMGWRVAGGTMQRADALFRFDPPLVPRRPCR